MSEDAPESLSQTVKLPSQRQLKLLHLENPLTLRFGNDFFRALPSDPGVYFFHGEDDQLLYIGQSNDLRARVSSYRHVTPEQNPRRTLRLVSKITRIRWEVCSTAAEAIERESVLLLEHRPPFNRAGVWKGDPWWLSLNAADGGLDVCLRHEPNTGDIGPLPPGFRHTLCLILRVVLRLAHPGWGLADFPCGLMRSTLPREFRVPSDAPQSLMDRITKILTVDASEVLAAFDLLPPCRSEAERDFWQEERERLSRLRPLSTDSLTSTAERSLMPPPSP